MSTKSACRVSENKIAIRPGRGILFVDTQGLGDVVQSLPLLRGVCTWAEGKWPVRVLFATRDHYELVREEHLAMTPYLVQHLRKDPVGLFRLWLSLVRKSDLIVCAPEMSAAKLVALKMTTRARYAIGEASPPFSRFLTYAVETSWTRSFAETQDEIARAVGFDVLLPPPSIQISARESAWAAFELKDAGLLGSGPILGVQCSSIVPSKSWPARCFGACVRVLCQQIPNLAVISFGTSAERPAAEVAHGVAGDVPWLEATGRWNIRETLSMLKRCDLLISGDTGLMHMAAAVGMPTISIFGPTSPSRRAPINHGAVTICPRTSCHPCFRGRWTPCECIRTIEPEEVVSAAMKCFRPASFADEHLRVATRKMESVTR